VEEAMNSGPTLQIGSKGADVRRLQIRFVMTKLLEYTDIDGDFGPQTQDAVKSFQESNNLTAAGVVGPATWNALPGARINWQCRIRTAESAGVLRRP
jgi:peptidoglycan hydrolase-like protein with peptidoglycan-binding domain